MIDIIFLFGLQIDCQYKEIIAFFMEQQIIEFILIFIWKMLLEGKLTKKYLVIFYQILLNIE